jgi:F-type H+-transporting ATPase subunit gamma
MTRPVLTVGVLVVTSDRGLAGAYNGNVMRLAELRMIELRRAGTDVLVYAIGRKAQSYFRYRGYLLQQAFLGVTDTPGYGDARAVANVVMNDYAEGTIDSVEVFTTRYVSALTQTAAAWTLLPITPPSRMAGEEAAAPIGYTYEPSAEEILGRLLPRYVEASAFGILLEASAAEHAARRRAMKAATENAEELTRILSRQANQARQAEITTEISEIVGGAEALTRG